MRAFRVFLNGKRLCVAGVGEHGFLSVIVSEAVGRGGEHLGLSVGGIVSSTREFVDWVHHPLETGDEVRIKIVESNSTDPPRKRRREDPKEDLKRQKRYVRDAAKKLGWKITTGP